MLGSCLHVEVELYYILSCLEGLGACVRGVTLVTCLLAWFYSFWAPFEHICSCYVLGINGVGGKYGGKLDLKHLLF